MTEVSFEDPSLEALIAPGTAVELLGSGCVWSEGPAWLVDRRTLLWSDIPNDRVMRWTRTAGVEVERNGVEFTNGRTVDVSGGIITCSHGHRRVERWEPDGTVTPLVSHYQGRRFNSPNDVVVKSDGTIWFTDPPYGILSDREGHAAEPDLPRCYVFRYAPTTGALTAVTDVMVHPNGLAFSPDESVLYVSDTSAATMDDGYHHILAFDVVGGDALGDPTVFYVVDEGLPDGFRVDRSGHVFTSAGDGVHVLSPAGARIGKILLPEVASNCTFGGTGSGDLYITATTSVYMVHTLTSGATRGT